jgi:hypothetical protein
MLWHCMSPILKFSFRYTYVEVCLIDQNGKLIDEKHPKKINLGENLDNTDNPKGR